MSFTGLTDPSGWSANPADQRQQVQTWDTPSGGALQEFQNQGGGDYYWSDPAAGYATSVDPTNPNTGYNQIASMYPSLFSAPGGNGAGGPTAGAISPALGGGTAGVPPAPIQAFGPTPQISPTYSQATGYTPTLVDPNQNPMYMQQFEGLNAQAMAQPFAQQQQAQEDQAKARGLTGGVAQYGANQLAGEQAGVLAGMDAPIVQQGYGYNQADITGNAAAQTAAAAYGANNAQATNNLNAEIANQTSMANAGYLAGGENANFGAVNSYLAAMNNAGINNYGALQGAYLGSYAPQPGVFGLYGGQGSQIGNAYDQSYYGAMQGQNQAISSAFGAAGAAASGGASAGGG